MTSQEPTADQTIVADSRQDLRPFSRLLWQRGISHRIHERAGHQIVSFDNNAQLDIAKTLYQSFLAGDVKPQREQFPEAGPVRGASWQQNLAAAPLTLVLVIASVIGGLVVYSGSDQLLQMLTFQAWFDLGSGRFFRPISESLQAGQVWRLWTPIFLHFTILHLVFNSLWLWEFGRRIEVLQGRWRLFELVAVIAVGSNFTQYYFAKNVLFGGMSGVVYGLLAYCWGWSLRRPGQDFGIPKALVYMLIALMVLALSGVFTLFGFGAIANAAHFSGFAIGLVAGLLAASITPGGRYGL